METYLPIIKTFLSEWLQLTLTYPVYAAALAVAVWLLTATLYSIRIASLNRKNKASEYARMELQNNLSAAQQQMQKIQEELAATTEQMQKDQQLAQSETARATALESQLTQRNQQVAGTIQAMASSFDLGERPLPVTEDIKAEGLWQQLDRVIALLTTRLRNEQQAKTELQQTYDLEKLKRAEIEALVEPLQTNLTARTAQISILEQALEEQKTMFQQQLDSAQQQLSQNLEKQHSDLARLSELEQQALDLANTKQQLTQFEEQLHAKEDLITQLEKTKQHDQVIVEPEPEPATIKQEDLETIVEFKKPFEVAPPAPPVVEQAPVRPAKEQKSVLTGKLKNLFGKTKQEATVDAVKSVETKPDKPKIQRVPLAKEQASVSSAKSQLGKLKNLFGSKQQPEVTKQKEPETQTVAAKQPPISPMNERPGKPKYYFGDINPQSEDTQSDKVEIQPATVKDEQKSVSSVKDQLGKFKNLFGSKQQPKEAKLYAAEIKPAQVAEELKPDNPVKGQLGKLKNLFGKSK